MSRQKKSCIGHVVRCAMLTVPALIIPSLISTSLIHAKEPLTPFIPPSLEAPADLGPSARGPLKPLAQKSSELQQGRQKVLKDLYEQLEASNDQRNAEVISAAIEKLWLESGSDTVDLLMTRALAAVNNKELDLALELLNFVTKLAPNYSEGWNKRAMVHYLRKDFAQSMHDLKQVLVQDPRHFKAIHGLSLLFREFGKKRAALKALRKAMELHPFLDRAEEVERELSRDVEGQGI